ncbi:MAG: hypothetical protein RBS43_03120 [Candidatus Cloacimonas sp.]|nr:hypothetical protein [Candidatus Cloacimonas sp.]
MQNLLSFPRRRESSSGKGGKVKHHCHSRGGGNPALMNPVRDDTYKALQYKHIFAVLTELVNGLDSCLRSNDKTFSHKLRDGNPFPGRVVLQLCSQA